MRGVVSVHWLGVCLLASACAPGSIDALTEREVPVLPLNTTTKLLHWGGGIPVGDEQLAHFVEHLPEIEQAPFDGTVLDLGVGTSWLEAELVEADLSGAATRLASAPLRRLTDNFQLLTLAPARFDDEPTWSLAAGNLTLLGAIAQRAGLRGFVLDTQQYAGFTWSYPQIAGEKPTFAELERVAYARGHQLMLALLQGFADVTLLLTLSTSDVFREVCVSGGTLEQSEYGLLPAFVDGLHAARDEERGSALLIDAFLPAYPTLEPAAFRLYRDLIHGDWEAMQAHWLSGVVTYRWAIGSDDQVAGEMPWPEKPELRCTAAEQSALTRSAAASFAVMLDYPNRKTGGGEFLTAPERFSENTHSPEQYTALLRSALQASDRYVWSWTSGLIWWPKPGDARPLVPDAYVTAAQLALEQARRTPPN